MYMLVQQSGRLGKLFYNPRAWHNLFFVANFYIAFTLLLLIWGEAIWALSVFRGASFLTLHYSIYFGADWLGGVYNFLVFPAIAMVVLIANLILANIIFDKKNILAFLLMASSSLALLFILVVQSLVLYINWGSGG